MIYEVINFAIYNADIFCINFAVFCFGYLVFKNSKHRKDEAKVKTIPDLTAITPFYFEGDIPFSDISVKQVMANPQKKILCGRSLKGKFEVTREEFFACKDHEAYNEAYEVTVASAGEETFLARVGSLLVIVGTLWSLLKLQICYLIAVLTWILYLLIGLVFIFSLLFISKHYYKVKPKPEEPVFCNDPDRN